LGHSLWETGRLTALAEEIFDKFIVFIKKFMKSGGKTPRFMNFSCK
jgi:hypothetical protein